MTDNFKERNEILCEQMGNDAELKEVANKLIDISNKYEYSYHFTWLGMPIIQYPADIIAFQEIIYTVQPDVIVETGIARGGSMIFYDSMLELIGKKDAKVIGVDIDIREHNKKAILGHKFSDKVTMIQGSSIDIDIFNKIKAMISPSDTVLVVLDSNHTHSHVLEELKLYSNLVKKDGYLIVTSTIIEQVPNDNISRPWGKGNNAYTALLEFLKTNDRFIIDEKFDQKLLITDCINGFLKCVKDI